MIVYIRCANLWRFGTLDKEAMEEYFGYLLLEFEEVSQSVWYKEVTKRRGFNENTIVNSLKLISILPQWSSDLRQLQNIIGGGKWKSICRVIRDLCFGSHAFSYVNFGVQEALTFFNHLSCNM
ncbi:hypothetical protein P8452_42679 [Trifolium repens]|nr:hypothetical protein P8452_42679 [Trifolium repens]